MNRSHSRAVAAPPQSEAAASAFECHSLSSLFTESSRSVRLGRLVNEVGNWVFSYDPEAGEALSLTMPLRLQSYQCRQLPPVVQMNLPQGRWWITWLEQLQRNSQPPNIDWQQEASVDNKPAALACWVGLSDEARTRCRGEAIGCLRLSSRDADSQSRAGANLPVARDLHELLHDPLADMALLLPHYGAASLVSGSQPKVLATFYGLLDEHFLIKANGFGELDSEAVQALNCNEFWCLQVAQAAGLAVPECHLSDNAQLLLSKRFDIDEQGRRLGVEDFCVLQGKSPEQQEQGSLEDCAQTIRCFVSPQHQPQALADLYKLTLLNVYLGNGEAHLKDLAVLYPDGLSFKSAELPSQERYLAPCYDLVAQCGDSMALSLAGSRDWPSQKRLRAFAGRECQLANRQIVQIESRVREALASGLALLQNLAEQHSGFAVMADAIRDQVKEVTERQGVGSASVGGAGPQASAAAEGESEQERQPEASQAEDLLLSPERQQDLF